MTATASTDGGSIDDNQFEAAMAVAHDAVLYEYELEEFNDYAMPGGDLSGLPGELAWAMEPGKPVIRAALESDRLNDEDGAAPTPPRTPRTFLFGYDGGDDDPAFVVRGSFVNRYDDERVVIDTPAPWETPDDMTGGNDLIKELEWDDHHYGFEDKVHQTDDEKVWVIDTSGVEPLRELAEEAGYEWVEDGSGQTADEETLDELAGFLRAADYDHDEHKLVGGDRVTVRYESKQTGDIKQKSGVVTATRTARDDEFGFSFERDDGKSNRVKADDGDVGIYSTSQYPFMGTVRSVEVQLEDSE